MDIVHRQLFCFVQLMTSLKPDASSRRLLRPSDWSILRRSERREDLQSLVHCVDKQIIWGQLGKSWCLVHLTRSLMAARGRRGPTATNLVVPSCGGVWLLSRKSDGRQFGGEAVCREALDEAVGQSLDDGEAVVNQLMVMGRLVMKPLVRKRLVVLKLFIVVKHLTYWSGIHRVLYSAVTSCFW